MSHQPAISEEEKNNLLNNAGVATDSLDNIIDKIKKKIQPSVSGFKDRAMFDKSSEDYIWARTTAPGIIWLWAQQEEGIRQQWVKTPIQQWKNFEPSPSPSPSIPSTPLGWIESDSQAGYPDGQGAESIRRGISVSIPPSGTTSFDESAHPLLPRSPGGGSRKRRTSHKKRKTHHKSKRVHHTRRKHTHRHRHHHRHHHRR